VPWLRGRQVKNAEAVATARFYGSTSDPTAVFVNAQGELEALIHLPALYLDEMLRRDRKRDALSFLETVEGFVDYASTNFPSVLMGTPLVDEEQGAAVATVTTGMTAAFRAASTFEPKTAVVAVIYRTFFAYWDWTASHLLRGQADEVQPLLDNLALQCSLYRQHGIRGIEAAKAAAFSGAGERLGQERAAHAAAGNQSSLDIDRVIDEIHQALTEVSDAKFEGEAFQVPEWLTWEMTKEHVAVAAGAIDDDVRHVMERTRGAGLSNDEHARALYSAELDRVIDDNGLRSAVELVHAAVFG
jgi:hypothetical protein